MLRIVECIILSKTLRTIQVRNSPSPYRARMYQLESLLTLTLTLTLALALALALTFPGPTKYTIVIRRALGTTHDEDDAFVADICRTAEIGIICINGRIWRKEARRYALETVLELCRKWVETQTDGGTIYLKLKFGFRVGMTERPEMEAAGRLNLLGVVGTYVSDQF